MVELTLVIGTMYMSGIRLLNRRFATGFLNIILVAIFVLFGSSGVAKALSDGDVNSILNDTVWYKLGSSASATCTTDSSTVVIGGNVSNRAGAGMTAAAQQKFLEILASAGAKFNVNPNFIASFYYA